jgi:hypothetical protein
MKNSTFIRDTLIDINIYNQLSDAKKQQIDELISEFGGIHYIDVRYEIGPSQIARMSKSQHEKISSDMLKVFAIERKIKELLKPDEQLKKEAEEKSKIELQKTIDRIGYRIRDIEMYLQRKLTSNRDNPTKKEYRELKEQLLKLTA